MLAAAKENWSLTRFHLVGFLGYLAWHLTYTFVLRDFTLLDEYVIQSLVWMSEASMSALGWELLDFAEPGQFRNRIGLAVVHIANYLRIMGLMWIQRYFPEHLDFNHHYTFTVLVYAVIFWLWYLWAIKISSKSA